MAWWDKWDFRTFWGGIHSSRLGLVLLTVCTVCANHSPDVEESPSQIVRWKDDDVFWEMEDEEDWDLIEFIKNDLKNGSWDLGLLSQSGEIITIV